MDYWRMRRSYKLGLHRNVRQLLVLQNKLKIEYVSTMSLGKIDENIERLKQITINYNTDLICLMEVNKDWRSVHKDNTIWNGTAQWKENRQVQVSNNTTKPTMGTNQIGGTAIVSFDDLVFNISDQGCDKRKL